MADSTMVTNLREIPHATQPGRTIDVQAYHTSNLRVANLLDAISREMISMVEIESNNLNGELVPRNVSSINVGFAFIEALWQDAQDHNDPPTPSHEFRQKISCPAPHVIMGMPNTKLRMVCKEYKNLFEILVSVDSAKSKGNVSTGSSNKIQAALDMTKAIMQKYLGSGADNASVGITVPVYGHIGTLIPDIDHDVIETLEPSQDQPHAGRPDVQDLPSTPSGD